MESTEVAVFAAQMLIDQFPERLKERYKVEELPADSEAFLRDLAVSRGCVRKNKDIDWNRVAELIINDYRAGRFGAMSLERPPRPAQNETTQ